MNDALREKRASEEDKNYMYDIHYYFFLLGVTR